MKLQPSDEQTKLLRDTLETVNAACNYVSAQAWKSRTFGKFSLQKLVYREVREKFDLTAQIVVRLVSKVAGAYKLDRKTKRTFTPHGAIAYDNRILNWRMADSIVSIWCLGGRQVMPFVGGPRQLELLACQQGESDLACIGGKWYLFAVCEIETPEPADVTDVLGVDLGVKNMPSIATGTCIRRPR